MKIIYGLAVGLRIVQTNVSKDGVDALAQILNNPNGVITVTGKVSDKQQLIPVRNILYIDIEEEGQGGQESE